MVGHLIVQPCPAHAALRASFQRRALARHASEQNRATRPRPGFWTTHAWQPGPAHRLGRDVFTGPNISGRFTGARLSLSAIPYGLLGRYVIAPAPFGLSAGRRSRSTFRLSQFRWHGGQGLWR